MDIFASLCYSTDLPSPDFLQRKPEPRNAPIVTITMWKMILGQSIYQLAVVFVVHYAGWDIFSPNTVYEQDRLQTLVFNMYVWMQFFNQQNCRRVDNKIDIFSQGAFKNPWFIGVQLMTIVGQFAIVFKGGEAFDTAPLTGVQWGWSLLFGILTLPLGALIRKVPDSVVRTLFDTFYTGYRTATSPFRGCFSALIPKRWRKRDVERQEEMSRIDNIVRSIALRQGSEGDATTTEEQRAALDSGARIRKQETEKQTRQIDLQGLVEAAKVGRECEGATLEIHPRTSKDDFILWVGSDDKVPPSQNTKFMRLVGVNRARNRVNIRNPPRGPLPTGTIQRPQPAARRPSGFKWESLLRSKRR
jgi:Ca2+-transporting ATPase